MGMHTTKVAAGEGKFALEEAAARILRAGWDEGGAGAEVVAVDAATGETLGPVDRIEAHTGKGILHQAFLTLLVEGRGEDARLLLCRRSPLKRLWGGVLADSCAGHPLPGEDVAAATARRINEELGITRDPADLKHLGHVVYREDHGDGRCECEWCEVFAAHVEPGELRINQEEISEVRRVAPSELDGYLQGHPEQLAPLAPRGPRGPLHSRYPRDVTKGQSVCHIPCLRNLQVLQVSKVTSYKLANNASL